jgi:hypothetical protein
MAYYCLVVGSLLIIGACLVLQYRLRFAKEAETISGTVVDKVYRNFSAENRNTKSLHLKVRYTDMSGRQREYVADNSFMSWRYKINDEIPLLIREDKVMVDSVVSIYSPSLILALLGVSALYTALELGL